MKKLRLKRHGSFSIREGWFEKAINAVNENEKSVFGKTNGIAILGVGSNMVASIRYWLNTAGIIDSNSRLTGFGNLLAKGAIQKVQEVGLVGAFTGGTAAAAGGIAAAVFFGYIASLVAKPKIKKQ